MPVICYQNKKFLWIFIIKKPLASPWNFQYFGYTSGYYGVRRFEDSSSIQYNLDFNPIVNFRILKYTSDTELKRKNLTRVEYVGCTVIYFEVWTPLCYDEHTSSNYDIRDERWWIMTQRWLRDGIFYFRIYEKIPKLRKSKASVSQRNCPCEMPKIPTSRGLGFFCPQNWDFFVGLVFPTKDHLWLLATLV